MHTSEKVGPFISQFKRAPIRGFSFNSNAGFTNVNLKGFSRSITSKNLLVKLVTETNTVGFL